MSVRKQFADGIACAPPCIAGAFGGIPLCNGPSFGFTIGPAPETTA